MKRGMKGRRFDSIEEVKIKTREELAGITEDKFKNVLNNGSTAGTSVSLLVESILKGIRLMCKYL